MKSIAELAENVERLTQEYEKARIRVSSAMAQEATALNNLNQAQVSFDKHVLGLKSNAPVNSDWKDGKQGGPE